MVEVFILFVLVQEVLLVYTKCFIVSAVQERGWLLLILTLKDIILCCGCMSICVYVRERGGEGEREKRERGGKERREREGGRERGEGVEERGRKGREQKKGWEGNG